MKIKNIEYTQATEIINDLKISRQTFWRWRRSGKIPKGSRYRGKILVFTQAEVEEIYQFANRIEEAHPLEISQPALFNFGQKT